MALEARFSACASKAVKWTRSSSQLGQGGKTTTQKQWPVGSRTFTLPIYSSSLSLLSPHLSPPLHPASISFHCVPGVTKLCYDTLQLLRCLLNYGRSLEATALMKHAARSHISPRRGETYCWGVNYSYSKYHSSHHAKTSDKKPPATSGLHTSLVGRTNHPTTSHWKNTPAAKRRPPPSPCVLTIAAVRKYSWVFLYHGDCWGYIWPDWNG